MERRSQTQTHSHSASYGQACKPCVQTKTRCISRPTDRRGCERCLRLKKECQPSDSVRKRTAQLKNQAAPSNTQIARLEGRIEELVAVVRSVAREAGVGEIGAALASASAAVAGESTSGAGIGTGNGYADQGVGPTPLTGSPARVAELRSGSPMGAVDGELQRESNSFEAPVDDAEYHLDMFRSRMLPCFPFMHLAPGLTARQLRRNRPFLLQAIVTVTTVSADQRLARAEEFRGVLAKKVVVEGRSSVDLLLGLLTYVAWNTECFLNQKCSLSHLVMLAISLVHDLRLSKSVPQDVHGVTVVAHRGEGDGDGDTGYSQVEGLLEQQRAVLACFLLSSVISSHFGLIDALQWTPQLEEALRMLETKRNAPTDEAFALQVRMQLIVQRTAQVREHAEGELAHTVANATTASLPTLLYLKTLQDQLRELRNSVSQEVQQQDIVAAYACYIELCINDAARPARSDASPLATTESNAGNSYGGIALGLELFQYMWRSINAIKSWFDVFYRIPPSACVGLPFFFWSQLVRCIMILKHLSILEDPAWDCQAVRNTIDLLRVLNWIIEKIELASGEAGESSDNDSFKQFAKMLCMSRAWVGTRWKAEQVVEENQGPSPISNAAAGVDCDMAYPCQMAWLQSVDFENDEWFEELFGWSSTNH